MGNSPNVLKIVWAVIKGIMGILSSFISLKSVTKFIIQNLNPKPKEELSRTELKLEERFEIDFSINFL